MRYEDFVLHLEPVGETDFRARVLSSPAGEGECLFDLPAVGGELSHLVTSAARYYESVRTRSLLARGPSRQLAPDDSSADALSLPRLGRLLFDAAIAGEVRSRLDQSLGQIRATPHTGLRIRIQMALGDPKALRLAALPWELLFRSDEGAYLGLDPRTPVVRHLRLAQPTHRVQASGPLRVLVVGSSPRDLEKLALAQELEDLERAWKGQEAVKLVFPERLTLSGLRDQLRNDRISVLHFMGHGEILPGSNTGVVFLEDEHSEACPISGSLLADQLRDCLSLRLVFLNACKTASVASSGFGAGVASALLEAGVPAVIAMQFPVTDRAALAFGREAYRQLAAGGALDIAVAEARLAVRREMPDSMEWATPVLFLRSESAGVLAPVAEVEPATRSASPPKRESRILVAVVAAGALTAAGLWGAQLLSKTGSKAPATGSTVTEPPPEVKPPLPENKPEEKPDSTEREAKPRPVPAGPATYTHSDGGSTYLKAAAANVSVTFNTYFGTPFVRLAVAPDGGESSLVPVLAPKSIPVGASGKSITVVSIDWNGRVIRLRG